MRLWPQLCSTGCYSSANWYSFTEKAIECKTDKQFSENRWNKQKKMAYFYARITAVLFPKLLHCCSRNDCISFCRNHCIFVSCLQSFKQFRIFKNNWLRITRCYTERPAGDAGSSFPALLSQIPAVRSAYTRAVKPKREFCEIRITFVLWTTLEALRTGIFLGYDNF